MALSINSCYDAPGHRISFSPAPSKTSSQPQSSNKKKPQAVAPTSTPAQGSVPNQALVTLPPSSNPPLIIPSEDEIVEMILKGCAEKDHQEILWSRAHPWVRVTN
jgi:hypothetical protein